MADNKTVKKKNADKRKQVVKLTCVLVLFAVVVFVFSYAWFTNFKSNELSGINMGAVGRQDIESDMNAYYMEDGNGDWTEFTDGIEFIPQDYLTVKFVLSNKSDEARNFILDYDKLQVKYYKIQPFLSTDWTADSNGYYEKNNVEFPYNKDYVTAGNYVDENESAVDYHTITTEDYLKFLKPSTNAIRYCLSNLTVVPVGSDESQTADNAKKMVMTPEQLDEVKEYVKSRDVICQTDAQDLTALDTSQPVDVVPKNAGGSKQLTNVLNPSDSGNNYINSDGTIHIDANTVTVLYMTLYFDPNIYSTAELSGTEITMKNSNPFMYQYVYLNGIKLSSRQ